MIELNKIYNLDCLRGLSYIDNNVIDLTITSPPYDDLRDYNGYNFDFEYFKKVANELYRVTKKGGVIVWVVGDKTFEYSESGTSFKQALYFKDIGFKLYDTMIFAKNNPKPMNHARYEQQFEYMFILSKGKPSTFNGLKIPCKHSGEKRTGTYRHDSKANLSPLNTEGKVGKEKLRYNIWYYNVNNNSITKDKEAHNHSAIFPELLVKDHLDTWSNEDDIILDIFMGSGTVAKIAYLNKRNFIGFEISEEYCRLAETRLKKYICAPNR